MRDLTLSTARTIMVFLAASSDHVTGKTGLTLTVTASKNGGAFASIAPTVTERGDGWYAIALTASHTDTLGDLALHITGTDADPADVLCQVVSYATSLATILTRTASSTITPVSPVGASADDPIDVLDRDEYSTTTDQPVTFDVEDVDTAPDSVYFDVSYRRENLINTLCTATLAGTTLTITVPQLTAAEIQLLPYGALADFRFYGKFGATPERTYRRGKVSVTEVATPPPTL